MASQAAKAEAHRHGVCKIIESNSHILDLLSIATTDAKKAFLIQNLLAIVPTAFDGYDREPDRAFEMLTRWLGRYKNEYPHDCQAITLALRTRLDLFTQRRQDRRRFIERIGLDWSPDHKAATIKLVHTIYRQQLPEGKEYPPRKHWMFESDEIYNKWRWYIKGGPLPDKRDNVRSMHHVEPQKLQLDIGPDRSVIVRDKTTRKLVLLVIRDFTMDPELLAHVGGVIMQNLEVRQDIRLRDPGKMIQTGISAGARHKPIMDWVRNILRNRASGAEVDQLDRKTAHVFSLFWMLIRRKLPDEVSDDIIDWLTDFKIHRMNKDMLQGLQAESTIGEIDLDIGKNIFTFQNAEYAPPSGVMAANYSRHVHRERGQPHKFAIAWTVSRTLANHQGGHFFNCDYGIRVRGSSDMVHAWDPQHWHGTSLQYYNPTDLLLSHSHQAGLAIITPPRLKKLFKEYAARRATLQQVQQAAIDSGEE